MCVANHGKWDYRGKKRHQDFIFMRWNGEIPRTPAAAGVVASGSARPAAGRRGEGGMLPPDHMESVNLSLRPGRGGAGRRGEERAALTIRNFRAKPGSLGGGNNASGGRWRCE